MQPKECTKDQFRDFTVRLSEEMQDAHFDYQMMMALGPALEEHSEAANRSPEFWNRVEDNLRYSVVMRLGRIYDTTDGTISLPFWLNVIKEHPTWYDEETLTDHCLLVEKPNLARLGDVIESVSVRDPDVQALIKVRGSRFAHIGQKVYLKRHQAIEPGFTYRNAKALLERCRAILNTYCGFFHNESYSTTMAGEDDFMFVVEAVQDRFERLRREEK